MTLPADFHRFPQPDSLFFGIGEHGATTLTAAGLAFFSPDQGSHSPASEQNWEVIRSHLASTVFEPKKEDQVQPEGHFLRLY